MTAEDEWLGSTATDPARRSITTKNLTGPDIDIFKSDSSKFEIGGNDTKAAMNINTAEKYSRSVTIPAAITRKNNPNIQRKIPLNVIFTGSFWPICIPHFSFQVIGQKNIYKLVKNPRLSLY